MNSSVALARTGTSRTPYRRLLPVALAIALAVGAVATPSSAAGRSPSGTVTKVVAKPAAVKKAAVTRTVSRNTGAKAVANTTRSAVTPPTVGAGSPVRTAAATIPQPVGDRTATVLSYAEEFSGTTLDQRAWGTCYYFRTADCTNEWNNELQVYRPGNVTVSGGAVHLTARPEKATGYLQNGTPKQFDYTSGMISSHDKVAFHYGYAEFRARVPKGQGIWPALWLLPQSKTWPPEIDIMEYIGHQPDRVYMTNHPGNGTPATSFAYVGPDFSQDWHTYAIDWQPNALTFYVDGIERGKVTSQVPNEPMYLLANVAVGGNWPGSPDLSTPFPAVMDVDYLRVWDGGAMKAPSFAAPVPAVPAVPAPVLPAPTAAPVGQLPADSGLSDSFDGPTLDRTRWSAISSGAAIVDGRLVLTGTTSYPSVRTGIRDFTQAKTSVQVTSASTGSTAEMFFNLGSDPDNQVSILKSGRNLNFRQTTRGVTSDEGTVRFDAAKHRYWRILTTVQAQLWQTSTDGRTWLTRRSSPLVVDLSAASVQLRAGTRTQGAVAPASFDDLVVQPRDPLSAPVGPTATSPIDQVDLSDTFDGTSLNAQRWPAIGGGASLAGGLLSLTGSSSYPSVTSAVRNLGVASTTVKVASASVGSSSEMFLNIGSGEANQVSILKSGDNLVFRQTSQGVTTLDGTVAFNADAHRYWRISSTGLSTLWQTSADGQNWLTRRRNASTVDLTAASVQLRAGTWTWGTSAPAAFDDLVVQLLP